MANKTETLIPWNYEENVTAAEFITRITSLVCDAMHTAMECDGDMLLSDYRNLCLAANHLRDAAESIRKEGA